MIVNLEIAFTFEFSFKTAFEFNILFTANYVITQRLHAPLQNVEERIIYCFGYTFRLLQN